MKNNLNIVSVMTPFPYSIDVSSTIAQANQLMAEHDIRHLPVYEDGDLTAIVSERDLERACSPGHRPDAETDLLVSDICTYNPYVADVADPLDKVLDAMVDHRLGAVLVMKEGEMAGIFTAHDACQLLAKTLRSTLEGEPDDIIA